jgi:hypothetical protein
VTKVPRTVTAEFVHEQDPETVLRLTGKPQTSGVNVEPNRNYRTRLYSTVNPSDKPGLYTIKALHADYGQGDPISFVQLPEDEFRIERAAIPPPKVRSVLKWNRE